MVTIVGVRFKSAGKIYYFSPVNCKLQPETVHCGNRPGS